jgi:chromosome segregation ATPase
MKYTHRIAFIGAAWLLNACGAGAEEKIRELEAENAVLKSEIENKERAMEDFMETFVVLDSNLTRIEELQTEIRISRNVGAKEKISALFDEIIRLSEENEKLAKRVENTPISGKAVKKVQEELERRLEESKKEIQKLTQENTALRQQLDKRQREIQAKDSLLNVKDKTLAESESEKRKLESAVREKEAANREERARTLFAEGKNFEDLGDKTSGTFKPKEKRDYYQKACEKYKQARELGHPQAVAKIQDIKEKTKGKACDD